MQSSCQPVAVTEIEVPLVGRDRHQTLDPFAGLEKTEKTEPLKAPQWYRSPRLLDPEKAGQFGVEVLEDRGR